MFLIKDHISFVLGPAVRTCSSSSVAAAVVYGAVWNLSFLYHNKHCLEGMLFVGYTSTIAVPCIDFVVRDKRKEFDFYCFGEIFPFFF